MSEPERVADVLLSLDGGADRLWAYDVCKGGTHGKSIRAMQRGAALIRDLVCENRRLRGLESCRDCGSPMDNDDPDEGDDQWYCCRCRLESDVAALRVRVMELECQREQGDE